MAVDVAIDPATAADAEELAPRLRPEEIAEVLAADGMEPLQALLESVSVSQEAYAVRLNGEVAFIFGVMLVDESPDCGRIGAAWLLSSGLVDRYPVTFWRISKNMLPWLLERWDALINAIDVRHTKAIRWAKRLGIPLREPAPFGAAGQDFCCFLVTREDLCARP